MFFDRCKSGEEGSVILPTRALGFCNKRRKKFVLWRNSK